MNFSSLSVTFPYIFSSFSHRSNKFVTVMVIALRSHTIVQNLIGVLCNEAWSRKNITKTESERYAWKRAQHNGIKARVRILNVCVRLIGPQWRGWDLGGSLEPPSFLPFTPFSRRLMRTGSTRLSSLEAARGSCNPTWGWRRGWLSAKEMTQISIELFLDVMARFAPTDW